MFEMQINMERLVQQMDSLALLQVETKIVSFSMYTRQMSMEV